MKTKHLAAAVLTLAACATAQAAPFATTYQGRIAASTIPGIHDGQRYTLTLVMDNGRDSTDMEIWEPRSLTCAIWRMNDAGNVAAAYDLTALPPVGVGAVETSGGGELIDVFARVEFTADITPAAVRARGLPPGWVVGDWYADGHTREVFTAADTQADTQAFEDAAGSVRMTPAYWTDPAPFAGNCLDAANPPGAGGSVAAVPTLGHAALALLGALVGGLGLRAKRRGNS